MRRTQDLAFPLGLGSNGKKPPHADHQNGTLKNNKVLPGSSAGSDLDPRAPISNLDTINL